MPRKAKKEEEVEEMEEEEEEAAGEFLADVVFAVSGKLSRTQAAVKKLIADAGGTFATTVTKRVTHVLATKEEVESGSDKIAKAKDNDLFVVSEAFLDECIKAKKKLDEAPYLLVPKGAAAKEEEEEKEEEKEEEEEEEPKSKKRAAAQPADGQKQAKRAKAATSSDDEPEVKAKILVKGHAAVDSYTGMADCCHVLEEDGCIWDCMLNQTNIGNNNNKFYVIQLLKSDTANMYYVWNRWGRVGERGQNKMMPFNGNLGAAKTAFEKKFREKTVNPWGSRDLFLPHKGKYTLIHIDYGVDEPDEKEEKKPERKKKGGDDKESKLDPRLQDLIKLIFDMKMMERVMAEMEFDVKKSPLGKLTKEQIRKGYLVLKHLEEEIGGKKHKDVLEQLTNEFYTLIPHCFGRNRPPLISDGETLKKKMAMLEALADIEIAAKIIDQAGNSDENPIDANYSRLNAQLIPVDESDEEFKTIKKYVENTHPRNTPGIKQVFRLSRAGEAERFGPKKDIGNRMLLWHGSRLTNFVGILSQGLRIAPPEAPASGYRFGKGIYFADICGLASRYCRAASGDFVMLLGDVALGKTADLARDTYMEKPQPGSNSTKALGTIEPDPKDRFITPDNVVVPYGKIVDSPFKNVSCVEHQYIVYDVAQVELKYLIRFSN